MNALSSKELAFLVLAMINGGLLTWLLIYSLVTAIVYASLALMGAVVCLLIFRRAGGVLLGLATISAAGALGLLLGCVFEFGRVGLFSLSSLCLTITERGGADAAWRMFLLAPVVHLGMWLGCSAALVASRLVRLSSHLYCALGMVFGMILGSSIPVASLALPTEYLVLSSVVWMWLSMSLGMSVPHWWCARRLRVEAVQLNRFA